MKKPRILVLMHYMELGGAEMALLGLLHALTPEIVDVDLFVYKHSGPLMRFIPKWVNLLPQMGAYAAIEKPITEAIKSGHIGVVWGRLMAKLRHRRYRRANPTQGDDSSLLQYVGDCVTPHLPRINPEVTYDLCISFLTPHNIGRDKVKAHKRLAWIHTDYSMVSINVADELPIWNAYDQIASISSEVSRTFLSKFPSLAGKIIEVENIIPRSYVLSRAEEFDVQREMSGTPTLLSIGRFVNQKNFDNVPDIARHMVEDGLTGLKWYIIGYGADEALIRRCIAEAGMQEHVILLGKRENPYPYIKACDVYVQPSRFEGKSITVREAQILCKPVAITDYATARSQVLDGIDGVILPMDNEGCAKGLADFVRNKRLQDTIISHLKTCDFANQSEVRKIYGLLK